MRPEPVTLDLTRAADPRATFSLDGVWEVFPQNDDTDGAELPAVFGNTIPVPGLWDMADAPLDALYAWYRLRFVVRGEPRGAVTLKIGKACWGKRVVLNGRHICDHQPNFTPLYADVRDALLPSGETNTLLIRVGAYTSQRAEDGVIAGYDKEKQRYIPGIFDDVSLSFTASPRVVSLQTVPRPEAGELFVRLTLRNDGMADADARVALTVREAVSGAETARAAAGEGTLAAGAETTVDAVIPLPDAKLWSPETPFLYALTARTAGDETTTRFGMRSFRFDEKTHRALLNGKPYYLRGTNITMYRFFEDPQRGDLPWRRDWARQVLARFKSLHMNCIRYCIGFPPELWYELADEMGFLIQDEYPIWNEIVPRLKGAYPRWGVKPPDITRTLLPELEDWIRERANHPCVVLWDVQNETCAFETGVLIRQLRERKADLSDRPFDNGWAPPVSPTDTLECHPYLFVDPTMTMEEVAAVDRDPAVHNADCYHYTAGRDASLLPDNPRITNEYAWWWVNRDGSPTMATRRLYALHLPDASNAEIRAYHDRAVTKLTEFWRAARTSAGILYFCGLTYCIPAIGYTCDEFLPDIEHPAFTETFETRMRAAMTPVGVCIEDLSEKYARGGHAVNVVLVNDLDDAWTGEVRFRLTLAGETAHDETRACTVAAYGREQLSFHAEIDCPTGTSGCLTAEYTREDGETVASVREFVAVDTLPARTHTSTPMLDKQ